MKLGILFSGGKDSTYAAWLARKEGHELACLISIFSKNKDSFMFHTPAIELTKKQSELTELPLLIANTDGEKEKELVDLKMAIKQAIDSYGIEGIITGALASVYQAERIQKICDELGIKCVNPLWGKSQAGLLEELIKEDFEVILVGIAAYPLSETWLGRRIDKDMIAELQKLKDLYGLNVAFEGGEAESLVLWCPLFKKRLKIIKSVKSMDGINSGRLEIQKIEVA
jgi:diphthine-ammonia ligase